MTANDHTKNKKGIDNPKPKLSYIAIATKKRKRLPTNRTNSILVLLYAD